MTNANEDPTTKYFSDGFPKQEQDQPGLTGATEPRPDHGEDTYVGSGKLTGKRALITGGDSGIGRAVAIAYAREGADVAISYLPEEQADAEETAAVRPASRGYPGGGPLHLDRQSDRDGTRRSRHPGAERGVPGESRGS